MSRITRRGVAIAALATGLVLAAPAAAEAHVGVSPDAVAPGASTVLNFAFTHGCEESPTTALRITMPEGLASVSPTVDSNWDIAIERADNGLVSAVTYTALSPIPTGLQGVASMAVQIADDAPESLAFPVEQTCESGVNEWVEIAEDGADPHDLESPAPVVTVDASGESATDAAHAGHSDAQEQTSQQTSDSSPVGTILGGAGLLAGIAALVVAVLAYRRRV